MGTGNMRKLVGGVTEDTNLNGINYADMASMHELTGGTTESIEKLEDFENLMQAQLGKNNGQVYRTARVLGWLTKDNQIKANIPSADYSRFNCEKYKFFLEAPFEISNLCCNVMKKEPAYRYQKQTGRVGMITAQMASESRLRTQAWLNQGCNAFDAKKPVSNPMAFYTEQDVLLYIKLNNIQIASVYGEIVEDLSGTDEVEGQMTISDLQGFENMGLFDTKRPPLKTTGCKRTGCMLCGFGCHLESYEDSRFVRLAQTHSKVIKALDVISNNGVTYREAIEWTNEHIGGKSHIYL